MFFVNIGPDSERQRENGKNQMTNQSLTRVNRRDCGTGQNHLETQEVKAHGNSMENPRENNKLTLEQPAQGINGKNSQRFQADRAQTESKREQKTPLCFDSQELMKMMK